MITALEERLSTVPRWPTIRTIQKQSVAEHSFRVALSAPRIAVQYYGITSKSSLYEITRLALLHDIDEGISGDIASPAKGWFNSAAFKGHYANKMVEYPTEHRTAHEIVKVADLYEALVFLYTDKSIGNRTVDSIKNDLVNKLRDACGSNWTMFEQLHADAESFQLIQQDPMR